MPRLRELGITIGTLPVGRYNAITDVPGVAVGYSTLVEDTPHVIRTGVTVIQPRGGATNRDRAFAGYHIFNGNGEMTGLPWLEESGLLTSAVALTNTHQVGLVRDSLIAYQSAQGLEGWLLPVVAETYDGHLSDSAAFPLKREHVFAAISNASSGPVAEGNVGGGAGMICHDFKGGTGTASRRVTAGDDAYTVGVLVQANYGRRDQLRVDGVPVGRAIGPDEVPAPVRERDGSIIVIVATDAPLIPGQCKRLARRATVGLARTGGHGHNSSGDIFLAFATGNHLPAGSGEPIPLTMLPQERLDPFFDAVAEATEEAILNALCAAETMGGYQGHTVHALPVERLQAILHNAGR